MVWKHPFPLNGETIWGVDVSVGCRPPKSPTEATSDFVILGGKVAGEGKSSGRRQRAFSRLLTESRSQLTSRLGSGETTR